MRKPILALIVLSIYFITTPALAQTVLMLHCDGTDGSTTFTGIDSSFLTQHLSAPELSILRYHMGMGKDFSSLTEADVVDMFL